MNTKLKRNVFAATALAGLVAVGGVAVANASDDQPVDAPETASAQGAAAVTFMVECVEDNLVQEPRTFTTACADAGQILTNLEWADWGADTATATGTLVTVVDGEQTSEEVTVAAGELQGLEATQRYTELTITTADGQDEVIPLLAADEGDAHGPDLAD